MLGEERRQKILERVGGLLRQIDPDVKLHEVILDSTRQQLAFVTQKGDRPIVLGMSWLDYVSRRDEELKQKHLEGLWKTFADHLLRSEPASRGVPAPREPQLVELPCERKLKRPIQSAVRGMKRVDEVLG